MAALRETAKNLLLLAASLAFTFALLELAFSAYYGPAEFASTPFGVYLHKPGTTYHFSGLTESGEFNTTLKTNSLGFFDGEWATEKSPNSVRFLFLGDSFVEAKQVPQDLSFSALSEALLSESLDMYVYEQTTGLDSRKNVTTTAYAHWTRFYGQARVRQGNPSASPCRQSRHGALQYEHGIAHGCRQKPAHRRKN